MITIPISWLLGAFFIGLAVIIVFAFLHLYHAFRFSQPNAAAAISSGLFVAGLIALLWTTYSYLSALSWSTTFELRLPWPTIPFLT